MTEERMKDPDTGAEKGRKDEEYAYLPVEPLASVARVYGMGAKKYTPRNWEAGYAWSLSYSALQRHANAFWGGEDLDPESNEPHLAHVVFHALALIEYMKTHPEKDDRSKKAYSAYEDYEPAEPVTLKPNADCIDAPHKHTLNIASGLVRSNIVEVGCPVKSEYCGSAGCNYGYAGHLATCPKAVLSYE